MSVKHKSNITRRKLINALLGKEYISGEELAKELGISRTMLWKEIENLRGQGFEIDGLQSTGYKIIKEPVSISADLIASKLRTKIIGKEIIVFESVDSTHNYCKNIRLTKQTDGIIVLAEKQTAGRGRLGRNWLSPKGGIWISVIISPNLPISEMNKIGLLAALSGVELLKTYKINADIKWPNDIMVYGRKIGGVLLEAQGETDLVEKLIISIGENINFPSEKIKAFAPESISASDILGSKIDINDACAKLITSMDENLMKLRKHKWEKIYQEITKNDMLAKKRIKVLLPDSTELKGLCRGITSQGRLLMQYTDNQKEELSVGEITKVYYEHKT